MITVRKASAGSGKTYALAEKYINMLMKAYTAVDDTHDRQAYRHVLAVTFTNKATEEMKSRILEELYKVAHPEKGESDMKVPKNPEVAAAILNDILHDYGSFAVSTIDKFFQQTLRAFARELGHFNRYEVDLDKDALVEEAVDTILDELDPANEEDVRMIQFMVSTLQEEMENGGSFNVERGLKEMGKMLKTTSFNILKDKMGFDPAEVYSPEALRELKQHCDGIVSDFIREIGDKSRAIAQWMDANGLTLECFPNNWPAAILNAGSIKVLDKYKEPTPAACNRARNSDKWFKSTERNRYAHLTDSLQALIEPWLDYYDANMSLAKTAAKISKSIYGLSVASRLFKTFERITREKNVLCLDDSNDMLNRIIDGSDAPFVYEKTGVRFKTFMLDEFQDTSTTQWKNFLPLLRESEAWKKKEKDDTFDNLVVGDVKQSIYRWRNSDWSLMDHQLEEDFAGQTRNAPLDKNWRSRTEIIDFNNMLYPALATALDNAIATPAGSHTLSEIYSDCAQKAALPEKQKGGCVDVEFIKDKDEQLERLVARIKELCGSGEVKYSDIAVLVRTNKQGSKVAAELGQAGIDVVTEASLEVKSSVTVNRLAAMMACVDNPEAGIASYFAGEMGLSDIPDTYHSLTGLAESLYARLMEDDRMKEDCNKEIMYVTSFMDAVMNYSRVNGDNLHGFLKWWDEQKLSVNATAGDSAVRILTIHKSKGLSFPYVIVPFVEGISVYSSKTSMWARPDVEGTPLEIAGDRPYYVKVTSSDSATMFASSYAMEAFNQALDALNMLYVATTRAEHGMMLLASPSSEMGKYLYAVLQGDIHIGEGFDYVHKDKSKPAVDVQFSFPTCQIEDRLQIRPYAADFFLDEGNSYEELSYLDKGIVLHDILSGVVHAGDLEKSVDEQVAQGSLAAQSKGKVMDFLGRRINSHPEFFPVALSGVKVLNETTLLGSDGREHRPDRVLLHPGGKVLIVDYKFGSPKPEYEAQIALYADLFKAMGYTDVQAYLWYVYPNKIF